ncbi:hypothetical protein BDZ85DRAFT_262174 [Elsinoe ampelina]|uniref:Uncharacterized protein n=1 Tax=Elsinoe ampelina TaxID=302913 RepID=A0A6A6GDH3_9PEZI|nr:hypothetical protein BDZ85DRAFT_262174 [Elsinoe ampelina]
MTRSGSMGFAIFHEGPYESRHVAVKSVQLREGKWKRRQGALWTKVGLNWSACDVGGKGERIHAGMTHHERLESNSIGGVRTI